MTAAALIILGLVLLQVHNRRQRTNSTTNNTSQALQKPLSTRAITLGGIALLSFGITAIILLFRVYGGSSPGNQLDAIRTAGTLIIGTGGAAALLLAARRQQATELTLTHQVQVARATEVDASERRITELYTKAVDQLGSTRAPVRLGGLYALERLAQSEENQRQAIVNVLCAYLRMPYKTPQQLPEEEALERTQEEYLESVQEREVRIAAQRILADHLSSRRGDVSTESFWGLLDLDLSGATLIDLDLGGLTVRSARFDGAHFFGTTFLARIRILENSMFSRAQFFGKAIFRLATFGSRADFSDSIFHNTASFEGVQFSDEARFRGTIFGERSNFIRTHFEGAALFGGAGFKRAARFMAASFSNVAIFQRIEASGEFDFGRAKFFDNASFVDSTFTKDAIYTKCTFSGNATFKGVKIGRSAVLRGANFAKDALFIRVEFLGAATFEATQFNGLANFREAHFHKPTKFIHTVFKRYTLFKEAKFSDEATFERAKFSELGINLTKATFTRGVPDELTKTSGNQVNS